MEEPTGKKLKFVWNEHKRQMGTYSTLANSSSLTAPHIFVKKLAIELPYFTIFYEEKKILGTWFWSFSFEAFNLLQQELETRLE